MKSQKTTRRLGAMLLCFALLFTLLPVTAAAGYDPGSRPSTPDSNNPPTDYFKTAPDDLNCCLIEDAADLRYLQLYVAAGGLDKEDHAKFTFRLTADITIAGDPWTPIGNKTNHNVGGNYIAFPATFDGDGHTITINVNIESKWDNSGYGIFGYVSGTVRDLTVAGSIVIKEGYVVSIGAVAGCVTDGGKLENCTNECAVTNGSGVRSEHAFNSSIGGVVGAIMPGGTVKKCVNEAAITDTWNNNDIGGVAGRVQTPADTASEVIAIEKCENTGKISVNSASGNIGGIAGYVYNRGSETPAVAIKDCNNSGSIEENKSNSDNTFGGVVGILSEDCIIQNCTNSGSITALSMTSNVGGVAGQLYDKATIQDCENTATITSNGDDSNVGGVAGQLSDKATIQDCENTATVTSNGDGSNVGGVAGWVHAGGKVANSPNKATVTSNGDGSNVGGVAGWVHAGGKVANSPNKATVSATGDDNNVGGVAGHVGGGYEGATLAGELDGCDNSGAVTASGGDSNVGGIAGRVEGDTESQDYQGNISTIPGGKIQNCTNNAAVTANDLNSAVGGVAGYVVGAVGVPGGTDDEELSGGTLDSCTNAATATVTGLGSAAGGVLGKADSGVSVINSYNYAEAPNSYFVTLTDSDDGITGFQFTDDPNGNYLVDYDPATPVTVNHGGSLWVKAILNTGYTFTQWATGKTANPLTITSVTEAVSYTPTSTLNTYTLTIVSGTGGGTYTAGTPVPIAADNVPNYTFTGWTTNDGGSFASATSRTTAYTMPANAATVTANYRYNPPYKSPATTYYHLTFNTNGGSAVASISRAEGNTIDLTGIIPTREGYNFIVWYADQALTEPVTSVKLRTNTTVYAKWLKANSIDNFTLDGAYSGFLDVDESRWYGTEQEGVIRDATLLGIVGGYGNGKFGPEDELKISEAIKMACVVYSIYSGDGYDFVQGDSWYDVYVDYAVAKGIIKAGDFTDYTAVCTRAEAAYIFAKALPASELAKISELMPPDVAATEEYATEIKLLYAAGIICGTDELGTFGGDGTFTRAQAAAIITRFALPEKRV